MKFKLVEADNLKKSKELNESDDRRNFLLFLKDQGFKREGNQYRYRFNDSSKNMYIEVPVSNSIDNYRIRVRGLPFEEEWFDNLEEFKSEILELLSHNDIAKAATSEIRDYIIKYSEDASLPVGRWKFIDNDLEPTSDKKSAKIYPDEYEAKSDIRSIIDNMIDEDDTRNSNELMKHFKLISEALITEAAESKICCICKKPFDGYGNNAEPICSGICCDECNMKEVIPARMKMLDNSSPEDIDEAVLNEDLEDYKITYYLSTATAERRPETIEDVENDWKEETFAADSDYDALLYALELIDSGYDDTDFSTAEEIVQYFDEKDLGDGSAFVVKLEGPNGVIYDMGQTKDDFIEQVKENDEMLAYYRSVLGIDESLNEGNSVSGKIPPALDSFLQDIAQMYQTIDYGDIMDHDYTEDDIRKLNNLRRRFITWAQYDEDDEEVKAKLNAIANKVAEILKRVDENITTTEKDNNKMNEDMSVRAKLKALYPELDFGDEVVEELDEEMNSDHVLIGFNHFSPEDLIVIHGSKEALETITDDRVDYSEIIPMTDKLLWIENNDEYLQVSNTNFNSIDEFRNAVEAEMQKNIDAGNNEFDILDLTSFYIDEDSEGLSAKELTDKFMDWIDESYVDGDSNSAIQLIKCNELDDQFISYSSVEEFLERSEDEDFDDDMDFDIEENADIHRMNTLYKGADFDEHDDVALEESSDCEDDECWENDLISDDYDDGM